MTKMTLFRVQYYLHQEHALFVVAATQEDAAAYVLGKFPKCQIMGILTQTPEVDIAPTVVRPAPQPAAPQNFDWARGTQNQNFAQNQNPNLAPAVKQWP